ncbi:hypothetical protein Tco_0820962 [Tanacetum coccineum]|uniref:Uncharacterized protein n=1 Tax=Tanacetum coccineum TaxID=301880 RepID=A0ABQ5AF42_9ASTR
MTRKAKGKSECLAPKSGIVNNQEVPGDLLQLWTNQVTVTARVQDDQKGHSDIHDRAVDKDKKLLWQLATADNLRGEGVVFLK